MWKTVDGERVEMSPEEVLEFEATRPVDSVPVPNITKRQFRLWLKINLNLTLADVVAALESQVTDPLQRELALIELEDATVFSHDHPLIETLSPLFGFDGPEEVAQAFREAALL